MNLTNMLKVTIMMPEQIKLTNTCSKSTIETVEKDVKYVQN